MTSWQDDLPPIPSERIIDGAVREGARRQAQRRAQRRQMLTIGGFGLATVAVVGLVTATLVRDPGDGGDSASATTAAAAGTDVPAETTGATTAGTAAEATEPEGTEAAEDTAAAAATTAPGEPNGPVRVSSEFVATPLDVWETAPGGPSCGPGEIVVTYTPVGTPVSAATVRWRAGTATGEVPMALGGAGPATATIGPFPPDALTAGAAENVELVVATVDASGAGRLLAPPSAVVLRDCPG